MTQQERRLWLIRQLLRENPRYRKLRIPAEEREQKDLLRALMNVRLPEPISEDFLRVQDEYLTEEVRLGGVADPADLKPCRLNAQLILWQGDITTLKADAIVNAANSGMTGCYQPLHNCIDNIIGSKAGIRLRLHLDRAMREQGFPEPAGQARITPGFCLPCRWILHTVGPIVEGTLTEEHERLLASCYRSCLELAERNGCGSIAFCCISTGVFMFPNQRAAEIAVEAVTAWLRETGSGIRVIFDVFRDLDREIYERLLNA